MQATLVTLGVVAVMAAIVGGGLKAAHVELPVLNSIVRQVLLGVFGGVLIIVGLEPWADGGGGNGGEERRVEVAVPATQEWTATTIDLEAGDELSITAEGQIRDDVAGHPDRRFTPDGVPDPEGQHTGDPHPFNHAALVGRIGEDGEVFKVGAEVRCSVTRRGRLLLGINDGRFDDNDGRYAATVVVRTRTGGSSAPRCAAF